MKGKLMMVTIYAVKEDLFLFYNTKKAWWKTKPKAITRKGRFRMYDVTSDFMWNSDFSNWYIGTKGSKNHVPAIEIAETMWLDEDGKCYFINKHNENQNGRTK